MGQSSSAQALASNHGGGGDMQYAGERVVYRYPACRYLTVVRTIVGCLLTIGKSQSLRH